MSRSGVHPQVLETAEAIDRAHLGRTTLGDADLAAEVLRLFARQTEGIAEIFGSRAPGMADLAHKLKGSARGVGAWAVADAAEMLEGALAASADPEPAKKALQVQIEIARRAIAELLGDLVSDAGAAHLKSL